MDELDELMNMNIYEIYSKFGEMASKHFICCNDFGTKIMTLGPCFFDGLTIRTSAFLHTIESDEEKKMASEMYEHFQIFLELCKNVHLPHDNKIKFEINKLKEEWKQFNYNKKYSISAADIWHSKEFLNYNQVITNIKKNSVKPRSNIEPVTEHDTSIKGITCIADEAFFIVDESNKKVKYVSKDEVKTFLLNNDSEVSSCCFEEDISLPFIKHRNNLSKLWKKFREKEKNAYVVITDINCLTNLVELQTFVPLTLRKESKCFVLEFVTPKDFIKKAKQDWANYENDIVKYMADVEIVKPANFENLHMEYLHRKRKLEDFYSREFGYFTLLYSMKDSFFATIDEPFPHASEIKMWIKLFQRYYHYTIRPESNFKCYQSSSYFLKSTKKHINVFFSKAVGEPLNIEENIESVFGDHGNELKQMSSSIDKEDINWDCVEQELQIAIKKFEEHKDDDISLMISKNLNGVTEYLGNYNQKL